MKGLSSLSPRRQCVELSYLVEGTLDFLPVLSVGLLATAANLGFDIRQAAEAFRQGE